MSDATATPSNSAGIKSVLTVDLQAAMKARDELVVATLRMTLAAIRTEEVAGKSARELTEAEVQNIVAREAKKRTEAADAFRQAGRTELADREVAEGKVLARYLPTPLTDAELSALVAQVVATSGAKDPRAFGKLMKLVTEKVAGRAPGARVAAELKRHLS